MPPAVIAVSIKFANHDNGKSPVLRFDPGATTVAELKARVAEAWPAGHSDGTPASASDVRAYVMGRPLQDDRMTLAAAGLPVFDYPTPVHVAVKPGAKGKAAAASATAGAWEVGRGGVARTWHVLRGGRELQDRGHGPGAPDGGHPREAARRACAPAPRGLHRRAPHPAHASEPAPRPRTPTPPFHPRCAVAQPVKGVAPPSEGACCVIS
jgi:hypothetical protein